MSATIPLTIAPRFHKQFLLARNPIRYFNELARQFGDLVHVRGLVDFYFCNDPDIVGHVFLNKEGTFVKDGALAGNDNPNKVYERLGRLGRTGLATSDGPQWKKRRRLLAPLFTPAMICGFGEMMIDLAEKRLDRWDAMSRSGKPFNIKDETNEVSLEVITKCLFDMILRTDQDRLARWFSVMKEYLEGFPYPVIGDWWFPSLLNLRTKSACRAFDRYAFEMVERRRRLPMDSASKDLVARMLMAKDVESGQTMSTEEICHEVLTFLLAGYESSASALLWTFYHLSQNPAVEAELHRELDRVFGGRPLTMDDIPNLSYTRRVVDEVMRISPAVWFMSRTAMEDVEIAGNPIEKGSHFLVSIMALQNHPAIWPTPERFDPNRFLPEASAGRSPNAYVPFGRGGRSCIGSHFSIQEVVIMTAVLSSRFRVVMAERSFDPNDVRAGLSMYPRNGIRMRVVRRAGPVKAVA